MKKYLKRRALERKAKGEAEKILEELVDKIVKRPLTLEEKMNRMTKADHRKLMKELLKRYPR